MKSQIVLLHTNKEGENCFDLCYASKTISPKVISSFTGKQLLLLQLKSYVAMFILANVTEVVMTQDKEKSHQVDNIPLTLKGVLKFYYYFRQARPYVENVHYVKNNCKVTLE